MKSWVPGHDKAVAEWAGERFNCSFYAMYSAFGIVDNSDGLLIGAAVFSDYYPGGNIQLSYIGPQTLTRAILREIGQYVFVTLGASRITCKPPRRNITAKKLLPAAGFKFEGILERYYGPDKDDDCIVYSLSKERAAKWLKGVGVNV
jgi:RimJ/RimL family protein N-acetyltransferase